MCRGCNPLLHVLWRTLRRDTSGLPSFAGAEEAFFTEYLTSLDTSEVVIYAIKEGTVVFPRVPLLR